jgi:hypothetical protein
MDKNNKNIYKIKSKNNITHPLTLSTIINNTNKPKYIVPFNIDNNNNILLTSDVQTNLTLNNNNMLIPSTILDTNVLLKINNINTINDIIDYVNNNINTNQYDSINRVLNCWIRQNFDQLKKNNNILSDIYFKIFSIFFPENIPNETIFVKKSQSFFKIWFQKKKYNSFNINLGNDLKKFLSNKYDS